VGARVLLHVGLQKSGTTYLQHAFAGRAAELAQAGVTYPVESPRAEVPNHQAAFYGLVPDEFGWVAAGQVGNARSWSWLSRELRVADRPLLLSAEALSTVRSTGVARVVDELGGQVRVLVTARRLDRLLASSWQQSVRNGRGTGFEDYLEVMKEHRAQLLADPADDEPNLSWRAFSAASLCRRWAATAGVDSVTVVVNSGRPADLLWDRMLEALDLPAGTSIPPVPVVEGQTNEGLRWAETDILAALNRAMSGPQWDQVQARAVRQAVIRSGFSDRAGRGPGVTLPAAWSDEVAGWAGDEIREIESLGCRVVGPLDDLLPASGAGGRDSVVDLTAQDYSDAAAAALLGLAAQHPDARPRVLRRALGTVRRAAG
jgi:hypothetical protein